MLETVRDRMSPYPSWREAWGFVGFPLLGPLILLGVAIVLPCLALPAIALAGWMFVRYSHPLIRFLATFAERRRFSAMSTTAQASLVDRRAIVHEDEYGGRTYTYEVTVRFEARRPDVAAEPVTLDARVSRSIYDGLANAATVAVRYSQEDPRIALLAGEKNFERLRAKDGKSADEARLRAKHPAMERTSAADGRSPRTGLRRPDKIAVAEGPAELTLVYRWAGRLEVILCAATAAVVGGLSTVVLVWLLQNLLAARAIRGAFALDWLEVATGVLLNAGVIYWCAARALNRTICRVTHEAVTIAHRPLPWPGKRTIPVSHIGRLDSVSYGTGADFCHLRLILAEGKTVKLMSGFSEETEFVKSEIEAWPGWRTQPEEGMSQRLKDIEQKSEGGLPGRLKGVPRTPEKGLLQRLKDIERKQ